MNYILKNGFQFLNLLKTYVFVGVLGLVVGVGSLSYLIEYVLTEESYDDWNSYKSTIFRIETEENFYGRPARRLSSAPLPAVPFLEQEVDNLIVGFALKRKLNVHQENETFPLRVLFVNLDILKIFPFDSIGGDLYEALANPAKIVLTESEANGFFPDEAALGKIIRINGIAVTIGAVIRDWPKNSHISFGGISGFTSPLLEDHQAYLDNWGSLGANIYVKLAPPIDTAELEKRFNETIYRFAPPQYGGKDLVNDGSIPEYQLRLRKLENLYLEGPKIGSLGPIGSYQSVKTLKAVSLFLLFLVVLNTSVLTSSFWQRRESELLLRQLSGAKKSDIIKQIIIENGLLYFGAFPLTVLLILGFYGYSIQFFSFEPSYMGTIRDLIFMCLALHAIAWLCSIVVPIAAAVKDVRETEVLYKRKKNIYLYVLVVFQITVCILLTYLFFTASKKVAELVEFDLGYDKTNLEILWDVRENIIPISQALKSIDGVKSVALSNVAPGGGSQYSRSMSFSNGSLIPSVEVVSVDHQFFKTVGIDLLDGRGFEYGRAADMYSPLQNEANVVINESLLQTLQVGDDTSGGAIQFYMPETVGDIKKSIKLNVIGVVEDVYFRSSLTDISPTAYMMSPAQFSRILVKHEESKRLQFLAEAKNIWTVHNPDTLFSTDSVENQVLSAYRNSFLQREVFLLTSIIFTVLSMVGIFSLASISVDSRKKETIVRKIIGLPLHNIIFVVLKPILASIGISIVIAWLLLDLITRDAFNLWNSTSQLDVGIFLWTVLIVVLVVLLTISLQTLRVVSSDPCAHLRGPDA